MIRKPRSGMVAYRAQAARARVSAMPRLLTPPQGSARHPSAWEGTSRWPPRRPPPLARAHRRLTWAAWTCPRVGVARLSPKPGLATPHPRPRIPALSVAPHCAGRPGPARLCARVWSAHAHLAHPHPDTHSRSHTIHTPRTGPHQRLRPDTISQTQPQNVPIPAAHTDSPRGHAIPGTHRRTQSTTTPQRRETQSPPAHKHTSTHTRTHTHTHAESPTAAHAPYHPQPNPFPTCSVAGLDLPSSPSPSSAPPALGAGTGRCEGLARRGRGTGAYERGPQCARSRRVGPALIASRKDKRKPAEREGARWRRPRVRRAACPPPAVAAARPPAPGRKGTRRRGPEAGNGGGARAQVS